MRLSVVYLALVLTIALAASPLPAADDLGMRVPAGFEVSLFADDALAHDIYSMTVDAQGRVVVAGSGYVKTLHDEDGDGRAERATLFSKVPASGAHGMLFDGPDLICTGDNSVMRLRDTDGDGQADGPPEVWTNLRHPEHGANGVVRGPDGCIYVICGNDAGLSEEQIKSSRSPVKHPHSGGILRFSPEGKPLDVYAHGFRNPYDCAFDAAGRLLTVDSDGERDHHLPWYAPTRLFDVAQGMEHGWLLKGWVRGWNRPESFFDNVERVVEIGRGSPTGMVVYRHRAFPDHYRQGVFSACWSLGRVYYFPLETAGASYRGMTEIFMQTTGDVGFAPCDLAIGPAGELYVAIGGRRTRGSVFRVRWQGQSPAATPANSDPLTAVLAADQPLSSWSRERWVPAAKKLGRAAFEQAIADNSRHLDERVRAVEVLVELFDGLSADVAARAAGLNDPALRARMAWAVARSPQAGAPQVLAALTADSDPAVQRAAWESLAMVDAIDPELSQAPDWSRGLSSSERRVRSAAILAAQGTGQASYQKHLTDSLATEHTAAERLADIRVRLSVPPTPARFAAPDWNTCLQVAEATELPPVTRLEAIRLLQIALGDVHTREGLAEVYSGYAAAGLDKVDSSARALIFRQLSPFVPQADAELNRELARLLGMLGNDSPQLLAALAKQWTARSSVEDDLHYLIVSSRIGGTRSEDVTSATAQCLLSLHKKLDDLGQFTSRNWPQRLGEVFDELVRRDPRLVAAIPESKRFGHAEHALFVAHFPAAAKADATRKLWQIQVEENDDAAGVDLLALAAQLPADEALERLRSQWENPGSRDTIVLGLSRNPREADREKFIGALNSPQSSVVECAARALVHLGLNATSAEIGTAARALKQACAVPKQNEPRRSLIKLLNYWTEENSDVDEDPDPSRAWVGWYQLLEDYYPHEAKALKARSAADAASWRDRLAKVDWSAGDAKRGRNVFEVRSCHRCHTQGGHLGPELSGAIKRMSREDLFTAIVDPNLEVSPAFQTTVIATDSGQVYHGLVVYESPEATLLQTGADTTVRITNTETSSMAPSHVSLMPTGLLDPLGDRELSDLYAYLQTLRAK